MEENTKIALQKLNYCINRGLGKIIIPKSVRDILDNQVARIEMSSEDGVIINEFPDLFDNDQLSVPEIQQLYENTRSRMLCTEMRREKNIEEIIHGTENMLEKETINTISQENVDEDWIIRFFNSVQDISDKKMQNLWSKILAKEIKNPNSFSLRSLDAMAKMSKNEAQLFEHMSKYIINFRGNLAIFNDDDLNKRYSINYINILALNECGIIDSNALMNLTLYIDNKIEMDTVIASKTQLLLAEAEEENEINISLFKLTRIGQDFFRIVDVQINESYFNEVAKCIAKKNKDISFSIHKVVSWNENGKIEYEKQGINISID